VLSKAIAMPDVSEHALNAAETTLVNANLAANTVQTDKFAKAVAGAKGANVAVKTKLLADIWKAAGNAAKAAEAAKAFSSEKAATAAKALELAARAENLEKAFKAEQLVRPT